MSAKKVGIIWFRNDLRLNDNYVLNKAIKALKSKELDLIIPFYCFDIEQIYGESREAKLLRCGPIRLNFIIECVENLQKNLFNKLGSNLFVTMGIPEQEICKLFDCLEESALKSSFKIVKVFAQREVVYDEIQTENKLRKILRERKAELDLIWDLTMVHPDDLPFEINAESLPLFTKVATNNDGSLIVRKPVNIPKEYTMPTFNPTTELSWDEKWLDKVEVFKNPARSAVANMKGGEDEAERRLNYFLFETNGLDHYSRTRSNLIGTDYSSKISLWLAYGCISTRYIYTKIKNYELDYGSSMDSKKFAHFFLYRDFMKFYAYVHGRRIFYKNPIRYKEASSSNSSLKWSKDMALFEKWCNGETGYPFIDANMKELKETGYMSNRGRQNVASFLAKDAQILWTMGAEYFENTLIDYDCAVNWYMWRWCSGVGDSRSTEWHFNNVKQAYDFDLNGDYVKTWLPALSRLPQELMHSPFRMSLTEQRRFKCKIGKDYPDACLRLKNEWKQINFDKATKAPAQPRLSDFDKFSLSKQ